MSEMIWYIFSNRSVLLIMKQELVSSGNQQIRIPTKVLYESRVGAAGKIE